MSEYKYIRFVEPEPKQPRKTSIWSCLNKKSNTELGTVRWYAPWRQYCFFNRVQAVYSAGCLDDISDFIKRAMEERKEEKS